MATARKKKASAKAQRINFRASDREERLIRLGAEMRGEKVSRFIVESACSAAEIALADEKHFRLPATQFAQFIEALERPARVIPELRRLFTEESVIEQSARQRPE